MSEAVTRPDDRDVVIPAMWRDFYEATHIPAAVRVGDVLRLTGHTGDAADGTFSPDPLEQTRQTFRNISLTLGEAGASWSDVVEINSYRVGLRAQAEVLLTVAPEFLADPYPAWTDVGVTELFEPEAVVEIRCIAILPRQHQSDRPTAR
jgi:enamine deaminase RidA (YjgF/YER057c/UK114 family)